MKTLGRLSLTCLGLMIVAGCTTAPTRLEADYRLSHHLIKLNQILYPEAAENLEPVYGLDGEAAKETLDRYRKNFAQPSPPPRFVLPAQEFAR
jgi:hypothetical protein